MDGKFYITSVEDEVCGVVGRTEAVASPAREQQERQDSTVSRRPIPSIDLAMALQERKRHSHGDVANGNDAAGVIPLTGGANVPASTTTTITMATVSSSSRLQRNWPIVSQPLALLTIFALLWAIAAAILPPELSHPSGGLLRLLFLFVGAQTCGVLVVSLTGLPDMLGMLFWGVLYANVGWADFSGYGRVEVFLREMALVNIMLLAGLGLDYRALRSLFRFIMQLTVVPTVAEVMTVTILARYLLALPWLWGVLLGLVVTAISPNVVVTVLLRLKEERLGLNKGIHTLIIAVTSCNDVLAIFLFGVILGLIFTTGNLTSQILQGPIGIIIGLVYGTACGLAVLHLPSHQAKYSNGLRFTMTTLAGALSVVGSKAVGYPTAGALGCIVTAFVAGTGWRKRPPAMATLTTATERDNEVSVYLDLLWKFLKPVSFSLIGKEVNFGVLTGETVLYGLITLAVAVLLRLTFAYLSTLGSELNWRERGYVTLSGFPKATVQAALGPAALDLARTLNATDQYDRAQTVLIVTVLAIILTAPLGALLMIKLAPRWLKQGDDDHDDDDDHRYRQFGVLPLGVLAPFAAAAAAAATRVMRGHRRPFGIRCYKTVKIKLCALNWTMKCPMDYDIFLSCHWKNSSSSSTSSSDVRRSLLRTENLARNRHVAVEDGVAVKGMTSIMALHYTPSDPPSDLLRFGAYRGRRRNWTCNPFSDASDDGLMPSDVSMRGNPLRGMRSEHGGNTADLDWHPMSLSDLCGIGFQRLSFKLEAKPKRRSTYVEADGGGGGERCTPVRDRRPTVMEGPASLGLRYSFWFGAQQQPQQQ
ncbi:hypothetical protein AND_008669 [Anopheles darlingi]|uniref:Cation/H+ exchanger transmembrane domain-containing protein n=1 Tax=Anopheles darlingi TaxID=43151 RepID=W5JA51_ANODA|nr:hypothetical protein AND_008669 [Anopheles darlingi]